MMPDKLHKNTILIYGGSFDPPHLGHLNTALNVQHHFRFERFIFLPCKTPLLKDPTLASPSQRLEMLQILIKKHPEFSISTSEIDRDTPSYMSETLEQFRHDHGAEVSITLLLGQDAFLDLLQWHNWEKIPKLCNVLMIRRPAALSEETIPESSKPMFVNCRSNPLELLRSPYGKLAYFDAGSYPISSTDIRHKIQAKMSTDFGLPKEIEDYILLQGLYKSGATKTSS